MGQNLHGLVHGGGLQLLPQGLGQVGHLRKAGALVQPGEELSGPETGHALLQAPFLQFAGGEAQQLGHGFLPMRAIKNPSR